MDDELAFVLAPVESPVRDAQEAEVGERDGATRLPEAAVESPLERGRKRPYRRVVRGERRERERQGEKAQHVCSRVPGRLADGQVGSVLRTPWWARMTFVREVRSGLWHWEARHPDWAPATAGGWGPEVSCYAIDDAPRLLLIDPLEPPREIAELAAERETAIVLTCAWHDRDARSLAEQFGAPVFVPEPEEGAPIAGRRLFTAGDRLPVGVEARAGTYPNDLALWIESCGALAFGDTLVDRGSGLELPVDWLADDVSREQGLDMLRPLLDLPVEIVLPTHGAPTDRAALERALA